MPSKKESNKSKRKDENVVVESGPVEEKKVDRSQTSPEPPSDRGVKRDDYVDERLHRKKDGEEAGIVRFAKEQPLIPDVATKVDDSVIPEKAINEDKVRSFSTLIDSILDNLRLVIAGSRTLDIGKFDHLTNISLAVAEMPKQATEMPSELEIISDKQGLWCLMKPRIRLPKTEWKDDREFLMAYRHIVEGGVKELYRIFRISQDKYVNGVRIVDPVAIGFSSDPQLCDFERARMLVPENARVFEIIRRDGYTDSIPVVLNPCLQAVQTATQNFLIDDGEVGRDFRNWVVRFVAKKDQSQEIGLMPVYGENNVKWFRCPHPRNVGIWLNVMPNMNRLSVPYTLKFIGPRIATRPGNPSVIAGVLTANLTSTTPLSRIGSDTLSSRNEADFASIMKAHLMPGQIQIHVEYDPTADPDLNAVAAIFAKMLFSVSPNSRNITRDSAMASDRALASWLNSCRYRESPNPVVPLALLRRRGAPSVFVELNTNFANGGGWCNMNVDDRVRIDEPLYEGLNELPQMAGIPPGRTRVDFEDFGQIINTAIINAISLALNEFSNDEQKFGTPVLRLFTYVLPMYKQYVGELNRYMLQYGECGFRMNDLRLREMLAGDNGEGVNAAMNRPLVLSVRYDSLYKFICCPPEKFLPPVSLPEQINAESLISAELQRVISAFLIMLERLEVDNQAEGYVRRLIFRWALESTESNHFAREIFDLCLSDGDASRLSINVLMQLRPRFDEFEAVFFGQYAHVVDTNPESFGFTMDTMR